jgi:MFS family permease
MTKDRNALRPDDAPPRSAGILAVLLTAIFIGQFDFSAVNVAAPSLERDLHTGPAALELVVAGYSFAYASGLITGARLGAMFGNRRVFATGMVAFAIASLLCGLATSPSQLWSPPDSCRARRPP